MNAVDTQALNRRPRSLWKKLAVGIGAVALVALKVGGKLKFLVLPLLKFAPAVLKTGGTMALSVAAYATIWSWAFALGFVLLILVHELGHFLAARQMGLRVGAPVFVPFMGAYVALKDAPRDAWVESQVGLGGPMLGALGAGLCYVLFVMTGNALFTALAYSAFLLNLLNLAPVPFLDGGRIVTALSTWLWLPGAAVLIALLVIEPNFLLLLILLLSLPRVWMLFRRRSDADARYLEVTRAQRVWTAVLYFGLAALLWAGMRLTHVEVR